VRGEEPDPAVTEHHISVSQFAELLGYEPAQIRFVAYKPTDSSVAIFVEDDMQTSGTCPPLSDNTSKRKPKGSKTR
jgi:hypothetical protein